MQFVTMVVSKSKDTSYMQAIHNYPMGEYFAFLVVSKSKDTSYMQAIHNASLSQAITM